MMKQSEILVWNNVSKCAENSWNTKMYMVFTFTHSTGKWPPLKFSEDLVCGLKNPANHYHGNRQQIMCDVKRMWDQSFGDPDQRVTFTEHQTGMSFLMVDGVIPQQLRLVISQTTTYFTWNIRPQRRTSSRCGERNWTLNKMCGMCFTATYLAVLTQRESRYYKWRLPDKWRSPDKWRLISVHLVVPEVKIAHGSRRNCQNFCHDFPIFFLSLLWFVIW